MIAETYFQLVTNVPHWLFEATSDAAFGLIGALFARVWVKRHDRKHHEPNGQAVTLPMLTEMLLQQQRLLEMRIEAHEQRHHSRMR